MLIPGYNAHAVHKSVSPTPGALAALHKKQHEELAAYQHREMLALQQLAMQQQQNQIYAAQLASEGLGFKTGQKRDLDLDDGAFDGFLADMKKRRMEPVYDSGGSFCCVLAFLSANLADMIARLNGFSMPHIPNNLPPLPSLNYGGGGGGGGGMHTSSFGNYPGAFGNGAGFPGLHHHSSNQSMAMPEIRTEADLALFNQFMISLGRDAAGHDSAPSAAMAHAPSYGGSSGASSSPLSDQSPIEDLFNPDELASLGLTGMPGVPIPNLDGHASQDFASLLPHHNSVSFGGLYPSLDNLHLGRNRGHSMSELAEPVKRTIAGLPRHSVASNLASKSAYGSNAYGPGGNHFSDYSGVDSLASEYQSGFAANDQSYNFDSLAKSKIPPPPATLAPRDFYKKTYRHVAPLGTAVSSRLTESSERSSVPDSPESINYEEEIAAESRISVRNLLISDSDSDPTLKLPAIHRVTSHEETPKLLPGVDALSRPDTPAHRTPSKRHTEDDLLGGVKRLELADRSSPADDERRPASRLREDVPKEIRRQHAVMIRSWLVAVNLEWRKRRLEALEANVAAWSAERDDDDVTVKQEESDEDELEELYEPGMRNTEQLGRRLNIAEIAS